MPGERIVGAWYLVSYREPPSVTSVRTGDSSPGGGAEGGFAAGGRKVLVLGRDSLSHQRGALVTAYIMV